MKIYSYELQPFEEVTVNVVGNFVRGLSGPHRYQLQFDRGAATDFLTGIAYDRDEPFRSVTITNGDTLQRVEIAIAMGRVDDNRLVGQMDLNGAIGILTTAARSVTIHPVQNINAPTEVLPANQNRRSAIIQCSDEVYVGNAADGVKLISFTWDAEPALNLVPVSGSVEVRILEELNA